MKHSHFTINKEGPNNGSTWPSLAWSASHHEALDRYPSLAWSASHHEALLLIGLVKDARMLYNVLVGVDVFGRFRYCEVCLIRISLFSLFCHRTWEYVSCSLFYLAFGMYTLTTLNDIKQSSRKAYHHDRLKPHCCPWPFAKAITVYSPHWRRRLALLSIIEVINCIWQPGGASSQVS